jgi:tRNA uridine 5-carboxymethylaminomethyl modification enzyme
MLRTPGIDLDILARHVASLPATSNYDDKVKTRVQIESIYAPYITFQQRAAQSFERDESLALPAGLDYDNVSGLSMGEKEVLKLVRPSSIGMARRIEGVTPTGTLRLLKHARRAGTQSVSVPTPVLPSEGLLKAERAEAEGAVGIV